VLDSAQAFGKFLKESVEPTASEAKEAERQEQLVRESLQKILGPQEVFISGSYGRGTAIRPLHDIDLFFVLLPDPSPTPSVQAYLQKPRKALEEAFPWAPRLRRSREP
jgi:tRNA nucleotidyltransferase (CCA-adding enzyme)